MTPVPATLTAILPAEVVAVERWDDPPEAQLLPAELPLVARAVEKRRREFATGRHCARAALAQLGIPPEAILRGDRGEPIWPPGVVGSITHCAGYRAAAVAWSGEVAAVGIDAEPHVPLPPGVVEAVVGPDEQRHIDGLAALRPGIFWDRLVFSAKETVYKVWYPQARRMLDFDEARVTFQLDGTFVARLLVPGLVLSGQPRPELPGRWTVDDALVLTAITVR